MNNMKHIGMTYDRTCGGRVKVSIQSDDKYWKATLKYGEDSGFFHICKSKSLSDFEEMLAFECENMDIIPF